MDEIVVKKDDDEATSELLSGDFRLSRNIQGGSITGSGTPVSRDEGNGNEKDLKRLNGICVMNICQILMHVFVILLLVGITLEAVHYIQKLEEPLSSVDWETFSDVAQKLKNIDFTQWDSDLNDIRDIKNTVAGYNVKVDQIMSEVSEMLKIMKEVEKYINGTISQMDF